MSSQMQQQCAAFSLNGDDVTFSVGRQYPQGIFAPVPEDQGDGFCEVGLGLFFRPTLAVRAGDFRAVGDIPYSVPLEDRREFVTHET